ncbi:MAG: glycosyltransferase, partial [Pseudomonadota bacterium]
HALMAGRSVVAAVSTHPGEERIIAAAHRLAAKGRPDLLTILAPRHPERGDEIRAQLEADGYVIVQRSKDESVTPEIEVYLADTLGELPLWFDVAKAAILGGSLVPHGGQNPLEALRQSVPVITGPHVHNFEEIYETLVQGTAVSRLDATDSETLADALASVLDDEAARETMITNGAKTLEELSGALTLTMQHIRPWLSPFARPEVRDRAD